MSNCIQLHHHIVVMTKEQIDVSALKARIDKVKGLEKAPEWKPSDDGYMIWWFLADNTEFETDGSVTIRFGKGRSGHTWRDFRALILTLSKYMKQEVKHAFLLADACDGFDTVENYTVIFSPDENKCVIDGNGILHPNM